MSDINFNRRIDRFLRRGRSVARSEWRLTNVELVRRLLTNYDEVLWVDADMCFVDISIDVSDEVPPDKDLGIRVAWENGRQHGMNAGFWLLRSTEWARHFLDEVWSATQFIQHPRWENAAFLHVFGCDVPFGRWDKLSVL